jgi:hypothetical protein
MVTVIADVLRLLEWMGSKNAANYVELLQVQVI